MLEASEIIVDAPTTWFPLPPTPAQATALARFSVHADDLSLAMRAWRAQAKDYAKLLPEATPYPGPLASPLRQVVNHPLTTVLPNGIESAWLKCDDQLPFSKSISDRGVCFSVSSLISDAMIAEGLAHPGQPLMSVDQPATRAWLGDQLLMIRGPGRDAIVAGLFCRALGLPCKIIRRSDTPQVLLEVMHALGLQFTEAMTNTGANQLKRNCEGPNSRIWWLDTTESLVALKGYSCAALELKQQIFSQGIRPSTKKPLMVFITSSNCLAAAGLARGLNAVFGPYVKTILVEDAHQLQALPTLCRWPKDPEEDRLVTYSEMGTNALVGMLDAAITVDEEHRKNSCARLPREARGQCGTETMNLFSAAAEHLRRRNDIQPYVVLWQSEGELN